MSFGERIKQYIDYKGFNVRSFESKSTLKNGAIYRVIKNGTSLNGESIAKIGQRWEDLNMNWLMVGVGEMLLEPSSVVEPVDVYNDDLYISNEIKWYEKAIKRADSQIEMQKGMIDALKIIINKQEEELDRLKKDL